jgi:hypothetical protein
MLKSQSFLKRGKKIIQEEGVEESRQVAFIRDLFLTFLGRDYHGGTARDLFDWEIAWIFDREESLYKLLDRLGDILDFLDSSREDMAFEREEGALLVALVEESAGDLPLKDLTELMQTLLSKKLL